MNAEKKKPFIPRNAPKSFIIFIIAGLAGLFLGGPLIFGGHFLAMHPLKIIGEVIFIVCWSTMAVMGILYFVQLIRGRYRGIEEKDWKDQVW